MKAEENNNKKRKKQYTSPLHWRGRHKNCEFKVKKSQYYKHDKITDILYFAEEAFQIFVKKRRT